MESSYIIGIDIGTGSTKAVAVTTGGRVIRTVQQFYPTITDGEKSEQDVEAVFAAFQQCIGQVRAALQQPPRALSLSSAMHSLLAVDEMGQPLTNAILWSDTRSSKVAAALRASPFGKEIYEATGTPLHSMSPLCKLRWLRESRPDLFARAAKFISIKEYIWHRLFDEYVIDHSMASATGLFNVHTLDWEKAALSIARVQPALLSLPVPVTYTKTGLKPVDAAAMNLPTETCFVVGGSDGVLANLGSLCLLPSQAAITIGTSAAVRITTEKPVVNAAEMIFNYRLDSQTFISGGAINNGGNVFQWLLENLFEGHSGVTGYVQLFAQIAAVPPGSAGLLFLPYLHGERAPIWDENSSGVYLGIQAVHTLPYFARAAAEGVCFALRQILSSLEQACSIIQQVTVSGGLVRSPVMMQMLADVTGKVVLIQQEDDASATGAAYLAQKLLGIINSYSDLEKAPAEIFRPDAQAVEKYQRLYGIYQRVYPLLKEQMHLLQLIKG